MAGPWEKYGGKTQAPTASPKPWEKYNPVAQQPIAQQAIDPQQPPNALQDYEASIQGRFMHGMGDAIYGIGQLVPRAAGKIAGLVGADDAARFYDQSAQDIDALTQQRSAEYDAARKATGKGDDVDLARLAGNIASPANAVVARGATLLPVAESFLGRLAQNAALGATGAALTQPVENPAQGSFADQKTQQATIGAAVPAGLQTVGAGIAGVVKPALQDGAEALMKEGIRLTPGQLKGGWLQTLEDKATSIPLLGDAIKSARARGYDDFNRAVANRALRPIGDAVPDNIPAGRDMVSYVGDKLNEKYEKIVPNMTAVFDADLIKDASRISSKADAMMLPKTTADTFKNFVKDNFTNLKTAQLGGDRLKQFISDLGASGRRYMGSADANDRAVGELIMDLRGAVTKNMERYSPADQVKALRNADKGWANLVRYERAAASVGAKEGVITPGQLQNSVKQSEKSVRGRKFARGDNLLQDLSDPAQKILPPTVPDSGTAGRAAAGLLGLGYAGTVNPVAAGTALGATGVYTRPGVAAMEALIAKRPELAGPIADAIRTGTSPIDIIRGVFGNAMKTGARGGAVPAIKGSTP